MTDWLTYANQGATRNLPLSADLVNALAFLPELGITASVYSGGQPAIGTSDRRVGSTRHDDGGAGDFHLTHAELGMLDHTNPAHIPVLQEVVRRARAAGITGIGMGEGYMGPHGIHIGFGAPAVWGAGGSSANAPDWLREAYYGADAPAYDPARPPSVFNNPESAPNALAPRQQDPRLNALAMLQQFQPRTNALNAADFMAQPYSNQLIPIMGA